MKAGLTFSDKNYIRRMINDPAKFSYEQVAKSVGVDVDLLRRFISNDRRIKSNDKTPVVVEADGQDELGPKPGTKEWDMLTPTQKRLISTRRNAIAKEAAGA